MDLFDGLEVKAIYDSANVYTTLSPTVYKTPMNMYQRIMYDKLDILVDLCGYAGTSMVAEIMSCRYHLRTIAIKETDENDDDDDDDDDGQSRRNRFPIHLSYMGFPGSCGSSLVWDYSIFDTIVVPTLPSPPTNNDNDNELADDNTSTIRSHYDEALLYMPNSYFVNSHKPAIGRRDIDNDDDRSTLREKYGIPKKAFIYCCHSRPDKIDPTTFRSWIRTIVKVRSECITRGRNSSSSGNEEEEEEEGDGMPVLWLLRSGDEMEKNLRQLVCNEFGKEIETECLIFANIVERTEHLRRLGIANVFLDTPAYNAHTLGCDALYMGVPMISLLRHDNTGDILSTSETNRADVDPVSLDRSEIRSIPTDKLASRVGASLLMAIGLDELICPTMTQYEKVMARCALDKEWYIMLRKRLVSSIDTSPLFDTALWVRNLEAGFVKMVELNNVDQYDYGNYPDIIVKDNS
jgi:protein O-GlcNAc transferase